MSVIFNKLAKIIFLFFIFFNISLSSQANSLTLSGTNPHLVIQRSTSSAPDWQTSNSKELSANITTAGNYKITVDVNSMNPPMWKGRNLTLELEDQADWQAISFLAAFHRIILINDGILLAGAATLVEDLEPGFHPYIPLKYKCWANTYAVPGTTQLTITFTLLKQ